MAAELDRVHGFLREIQDRCATRTEPTAFGTALYHDRLPLVWDLNLLRVEGDPGVDADTLIDEAERLQSPLGLAHRRVTMTDEGPATARAASFRSRGFAVGRLVVMAHREGRGRRRTSPAEEVDEAEVRAARAAFYRSNPYTSDPETVRQLCEQSQVVGEAVRARRFVRFVGHQVGSFCDLYSDGRTGQIEDVATLEEYRGRGLARSVVLTALEASRAAGHDLTFLLADLDDTPRRMYERFGFEGIGVRHQFTRLPDFIRPAG